MWNLFRPVLAIKSCQVVHEEKEEEEAAVENQEKVGEAGDVNTIVPSTPHQKLGSFDVLNEIMNNSNQQCKSIRTDEEKAKKL